jgi:mannose-1-phosphate guanylyltransferase
VQPSNKGTAPAILASLVQISRMDPNAVVAILPCNHYYFPEDGFTAALDAAFNTAEERSRSVLIMGIDAKRPEVEYGWIELGPKIGGYSGVHQVVAFHEKPALPLAEKLLRAGSLWNTFVLVGHICAFLEMAWRATPRLLQALESAEINSNCSGEIQIPDSVYERLGQTDFSREILAPSTDRLLALRLRNIEWADIGNPDRLLRAILHNQNASLAFRGPGPRAGENPVGPLKAFRAVAN